MLLLLAGCEQPATQQPPPLLPPPASQSQSVVVVVDPGRMMRVAVAPRHRFHQPSDHPTLLVLWCVDARSAKSSD
ncbi:hypothetical protein L596_001675 [Steinernema carpocapsae]|uniref:Uncharacterized protein n=1 Tax=Steinernema carpocapsae TaxID=34508 RepID=A0A4U8UNY6_STECR|nr:hypothetical protein L596_001675 [Steinernema carpocapsae]